MSMVVMREDEAPRTVHANLSLVLQVAFVGHNDNRESVLILYPTDLLVESTYLLERIA